MSKTDALDTATASSWSRDPLVPAAYSGQSTSPTISGIVSSSGKERGEKVLEEGEVMVQLA